MSVGIECTIIFVRYQFRELKWGWIQHATSTLSIDDFWDDADDEEAGSSEFHHLVSVASFPSQQVVDSWRRLATADKFDLVDHMEPQARN